MPKETQKIKLLFAYINKFFDGFVSATPGMKYSDLFRPDFGVDDIYNLKICYNIKESTETQKITILFTRYDNFSIQLIFEKPLGFMSIDPNNIKRLEIDINPYVITKFYIADRVTSPNKVLLNISITKQIIIDKLYCRLIELAENGPNRDEWLINKLKTDRTKLILSTL